MPIWYWLALPAAGAVIGTASALFGIGGGVLAVPFLVLVLGLKQHIAQSTSLAIMIPVALMGVIRYRMQGYQAALGMAALLCVGAIAGANLGGYLASQMSAPGLRRAFGLLMVAIGVIMIVKK